jgi:arylsulfatase
MEVYAAQIDRMDQGIGRILAALERNGVADDTLIVFLADNGACAEDIPDNLAPDLLTDQLGIARKNTRDGRPVRIGNDPSLMPGPEDTYQSYGVAWANLSNTPFRLYKHWVHEGGISTPLILHWPKGIAARNEIRHNPGYLPDIMATLCDVCGAPYPTQFPGRDVLPLEGRSLKPAFTNDGSVRGPMFWEHEGNCAMRDGQWKLVRRHPGDWELYDMQADRTELHDLAAKHPERVAAMAKAYDAWAARCGVLDRDEVIKVMRAKGFERRFYSIEDA